MANLAERRRHQRFKAKWPVNILAGQNTIQGETRDISVAGISITCEEPLRFNESYHFFITAPNHQVIKVTGKVMWSDSYGIDDEETALALGISFVEVSEEDRVFLEDAISYLERAELSEGSRPNLSKSAT